MQPYIIGVDIGTGSTKAVAVDVSGKLFHSSQVFYPILESQPVFSEQDPEVIARAFFQTIRELVQEMAAPPEAISLSSAMHSVLPVDEAGRPLGSLILWSDSRSAAIASRLRAAPFAEELYKRTGTPIHSMSPLCKLIWLYENQLDLFETTERFISIKEYLWQLLFQEYVIDHSIASATGLFDIERKTWYPEALELAHVAASRLSVPVPTSYSKVLSDTEQLTRLGLTASTRFYIGASDGCLANLGTGALEPGCVSVTIGTSGAVRMASKKPVYQFPEMSFNYLLDEQLYICGGPVNNGGNVLAWLRDQRTAIKGVEPSYEQLFSEMEIVPPGSHNLLFLPYLYGERAPIWDEQACGVYFGIRSHHDASCFLRAGIEGVCFALHSILVSLERHSGTIGQLQVSGGFVHAPLWIQILADITGKRV
ncbi:MAG TPA: gluconokinase, partial [Flavisolibacter sp.]|nr:gluconokinase [Flavisolibacter sp.]